MGLNCPALLQVQRGDVSPLSAWTGPSLLWSPLIYDSFRLERTLQIPISCQADAKWTFTGYKNPFLKFQHLQPFIPPRFNFPLSPRSRPCSRDLHLRSPSTRHVALFRFWEAGWWREFTRSVNKKKKEKKKRPLASHSSVRLPFVLPLLHSLPALPAHFFSSVSIYCPTSSLCLDAVHSWACEHKC